MEIPIKVQKILDKNKIVDNTESSIDICWWFKNPDEYEEPQKINLIDEKFEMHIGKRGPYLIRYLK